MSSSQRSASDAAPEKEVSGQETVDLPEAAKATPPRSLRSRVRRRLLRHERDREDPSLLLSTERYRYVRELGRGGMGTVVEVDDVRLGRRVAVKTVLGDDPARLARFRREARLASQLEHPHIVPVYDLDERPEGASLAMRKVTGESLGEVIRRLRAGEEPERGRAWQLEVFAAVCQAVAYAHAQGVIHRDIKPDNVLLGRFGQVFLTDFGLAKRVDPDAEDGEPLQACGELEEVGESFVSADGAIVGTPAYMAPEQASGRQDEVDARTDVYQLGVLLYELLTLRRPYEGLRGRALLEAIQRTDPVPPRKRAPERKVPRELEAIALKALAREKSARYAAVEALLEDLRAFQEGRTVSACRDPLGVRLRKWAGRHRTLVATLASGLVVALGAGVALAVWRDRLRSAELAALRRRQAATVPYLTGLDLLARRLDLATLRERAIPAFERALSLDPDFAEARFALGRAYVAAYRADRGRAEMLAAIEAQPGNGHWLVRLGQAYLYGYDLRDPRAAAARAQARRYFQQAAALGQEVTPFAAVGEAMVLAEDGQPQAACALLEPTVREAPYLWEVWHALGYARLRLGPDRAQAAEEAFRHALELEPDEVMNLRGVAAALLAQDRPADALPFAERAAERSDPGLATDLVNLGHVLFRLQRYEEAIAALRRALDRQRNAPRAWLSLGAALHAVGRSEEGLRALAEAERLGCEDPILFQNRGSICMELGRYAEALAAYEHARKLDPSAENWANRAAAQLRLGRLAEAEADLKEASQRDPRKPQVWVQRAGLAEARGDLAAAERLIGEGLEHAPDLGRLWAIRGLYRFQLGRIPAAIADFERALELGGSPGAPLPGLSVLLLSRAYRQVGQPERALAVLEAHGDLLSPEQESTRRNEAGIAHFQLAQACLARKDFGRDDLERARLHLERSYALEPQWANAFLAAKVCAQLGEIDAAFSWLERAYAHGLRGPERLQAPALAPLREDPRWKDWVERLGR